MLRESKLICNAGLNSRSNEKWNYTGFFPKQCQKLSFWLVQIFNKDYSKCILNSEQEWSATGPFDTFKFLITVMTMRLLQVSPDGLKLFQ